MFHSFLGGDRENYSAKKRIIPLGYHPLEFFSKLNILYQREGSTQRLPANHIAAVLHKVLKILHGFVVLFLQS